jgi:iron complex transport system permease protein
LRHDLTAHFGLRYDHWESNDGSIRTPGWPVASRVFKDYPTRSEAAWSPKLALVWQTLPGLALRSSLGSAFRAPTVYELYRTSRIGTTTYSANPNLKPETVETWDIGTDIKPWQGGELKLTYFTNRMHDLVYTQGTGSVRNRINLERAESRGITAGIAQKIGASSRVFANATLADSEVTKNNLARNTEGKNLLRLPRALAGFACGGLLALAGALMQVLLRNPLADPYVLGISGGAAVGAMFAILLGLSARHQRARLRRRAGGDAAGFGLAHGDGSWTQTRLLLTGVIVAAGCGALVALMLSIAPDSKLRGMLFWLMGDLSQATSPLALALGCSPRSCSVAMPFARELNLLARGADLAQALGVRSAAALRGVYLVASLATAAAVTQAGSIGFVGLIVPHLVRLAAGNDQRLLLPASALAGGSLLVLADTLARTLIAPQQLPVGVLTALIGVPVFLFLLARDARRGAEMAPSSPLLEARKLTSASAARSFAAISTSALQAGRAAGHPRPQRRRQVDAAVGARRFARAVVRRRFARRRELRRGARAKSALIRGWLPQSRGDAFASTVLETVLVGRHPHLAAGAGKRAGRADRAQALAAVDLPASSSATSRRFPAASGSAGDRHAAGAGAAALPARRADRLPRSQAPDRHARTLCRRGARLRRGGGMVLHEPALAWRYSATASC